MGQVRTQSAGGAAGGRVRVMTRRNVIRATALAFVLLSSAAGTASAQNVEDVDALVTRATILRQQNRRARAADVIEQAAMLAPHRADVRKLQDLLEFEVNGWEAMAGAGYKDWDDNRAPWREGEVSLRRNTRVGPFLMRAAQVERSGRRDEKMEFEVYPAFRSGYLALSAGFAPDATLYPRSTLSAELYKTLPADFEISGGYRRLNFTDKSVDVAIGSLGKYVGSYFVGGRVNDFPSYGTSVTGLVRRYLSDDGQYISVFGSTGSVPELIREPGDFDVISSRSLGADAMFILGSRLVLRLNGSLGDEEWPGGRTASFTTGSLGFGVRF